jgi:hypothetical protein
MPGVEFSSSIHTPFLAIVLPVLSAYLLLIAVAVMFVTRGLLRSTIKRKFLLDGCMASQNPRSGSIPTQEREDSSAPEAPLTIH